MCLSTGFPKFLLSSNPSTEASTSACVKALVARKENVWIVDSGCSRHMTGDKNWFSSLKRASPRLDRLSLVMLLLVPFSLQVWLR